MVPAQSLTSTRNQISQIEQCIQSCLDCHRRICLETITYCLLKGGTYANLKQIRLLQDCAEICQTAANFMARNSDMQKTIWNACAEICLKCAEICEWFGKDQMMKSCAEACRQCAEFCVLMVMRPPHHDLPLAIDHNFIAGTVEP